MRIDGYLTEKAKLIWPDAVVKCEDTGRKDFKQRPVERWWIEHTTGNGTETVEIGPFFLAAKRTINQLLRGRYEQGKQEAAINKA